MRLKDSSAYTLIHFVYCLFQVGCCLRQFWQVCIQKRGFLKNKRKTSTPLIIIRGEIKPRRRLIAHAQKVITHIKYRLYKFAFKTSLGFKAVLVLLVLLKQWDCSNSFPARSCFSLKSYIQCFCAIRKHRSLGPAPYRNKNTTAHCTCFSNSVWTDCFSSSLDCRKICASTVSIAARSPTLARWLMPLKALRSQIGKIRGSEFLREVYSSSA